MIAVVSTFIFLFCFMAGWMLYDALKPLIIKHHKQIFLSFCYFIIGVLSYIAFKVETFGGKVTMLSAIAFLLYIFYEWRKTGEKEEKTKNAEKQIVKIYPPKEIKEIRHWLEDLQQYINQNENTFIFYIGNNFDPIVEFEIIQNAERLGYHYTGSVLNSLTGVGLVFVNLNQENEKRKTR